ncbi:FGGY-family carbohydrate kinase [Leucobacter ruminantium]|uniref:Carbohydrate kinase FGGY N-terminal domain-containing protein n=1 Tax=Leucobacter ruminantium TaxID=1289170 RepID=A0A939LVD5_9MICO|nr:FGGY family carbohydrate kinase [Leucobacter ruminantium]MBO1805107.1 hypothetical protein [Leucobacter ruminantium]
MREFVVGVDMGSTSIKMLVAEPRGAEVLVASRRSPWTSLDGGGAEMTGDRVLEIVVELAAEVDAGLAAGGGYRVLGLGVSGMAEAGAVLDDNDVIAAPIMAWFDPRGEREIAATPQEFRDEFLGRTGLPVGPLASIAKLLHLRESGLELRGRTFLNVPEFVVRSLGGRRVAEYSLVSRTGLIDQDTGGPWQAALDVLGVDEQIIAERIGAGEPAGTLSDPRLPDAFQGAVLTVAGHDHLVSSVAAGATHRGDLYDSMGTAEALVRVLDEQLPFDARERLALAGINTVRHVLPGAYVLLAGTKSGLLMRRVLQLLGVTDAAGRQALDERVMALPVRGELVAGALTVDGARNDDGVLKVVANSDGLSPEEFFIASLLHGNDMCTELMRVMDREVPPPTAALLTGGWSKMASVVRARSLIFPPIDVMNRDEGTAYGAALFAAYAVAREADPSPLEFSDFADGFLSAGDAQLPATNPIGARL